MTYCRQRRYVQCLMPGLFAYLLSLSRARTSITSTSVPRMVYPVTVVAHVAQPDMCHGMPLDSRGSKSDLGWSCRASIAACTLTKPYILFIFLGNSVKPCYFTSIPTCCQQGIESLECISTSYLFVAEHNIEVKYYLVNHSKPRLLTMIHIYINTLTIYNIMFLLQLRTCSV